jgi:hypothetical protein
MAISVKAGCVTYMEATQPNGDDEVWELHLSQTEGVTVPGGEVNT